MKSHGRKSIRATLKPSSLMDETPELAGVWQARIVTLFPGAFPGVLGESLTGRALQDGLWQLHTHDLREHGLTKHRNVDDTPAGGGAGMVLRADVVGPAIAEAQSHARGRWPILYMSPRGRQFDQAMARDLARCDGVTMLCGRFEGVDERTPPCACCPVCWAMRKVRWTKAIPPACWSIRNTPSPPTGRAARSPRC